MKLQGGRVGQRKAVQCLQLAAEDRGSGQAACAAAGRLHARQRAACPRGCMRGSEQAACGSAQCRLHTSAGRTHASPPPPLAHTRAPTSARGKTWPPAAPDRAAPTCRSTGGRTCNRQRVGGHGHVCAERRRREWACVCAEQQGGWSICCHRAELSHTPAQLSHRPVQLPGTHAACHTNDAGLARSPLAAAPHEPPWLRRPLQRRPAPPPPDPLPSASLPPAGQPKGWNEKRRWSGVDECASKHREGRIAAATDCQKPPIR